MLRAGSRSDDECDGDVTPIIAILLLPAHLPQLSYFSRVGNLARVSTGFLQRLAPCRPLVERHRRATRIFYAATLDPRMFWLIRKKFVGSYLFFSFTSRL